MSWKIETFGTLLSESRIPCENPDIEKRIRVKLNVQGVEKRPIGAEKEGATKQFIRKAGQFIYGKQNFHKGAFGVIPAELDGFETSADIPSFDVREDCLPEWIYYFFKAGNRYLELTEFARGVGSQRIHPKQLQNLEIPLPPIVVQRKIITELKFIEKDEISTELTHQLSIVKQLRQAFLREAMQGKLTSEWRASHPELVEGSHSATELLAKIKAEKEQLIKEKKLKKQKPLPPISEDEIPFEIPESWVWCRLGDIFNFIDYRGKTPTKTHEGVRLISAKNIRFGYIDDNPIEYIAEGQYLKWMVRGFPKNGDILFVTEGHTMGFVAQLNLDFKYVLAQRTICLQPHCYDYPTCMYYFMMSPDFQKVIQQNATGAAATGIKSAKLKEVIIALPPLSEQNRIVAKLNVLMAYCDNLEESIKKSQQQNEMLLGQVLREALEPASANSLEGME